MSLRFIGGIERKVVYREHRNDTVNRPIYTFSGVDLGPASPGRVIIVGVFSYDPVDEPIQVTVAGVNTTRHVRTRIDPTIDIWSVVDATNLTATIQVNHGGTGIATGIAVWSGYGFQNPVPSSVDGSTFTGAGGSISVTVPADGAVVALAGNNATTPAISLTGVDHDEEFAAGTRSNVAGSESHALAGAKTITVTGNFPRIVAAAWS
jgi:hypothetical protein